VRHSSFASDSSNLDLIRAVAVLLVFFAHLHDITTGNHGMDLPWHFAQMGVLIFFVHTSMVLMLSLERAKFSGAAFFGAFYLRRFFRLYPLSMFCVTVSFLLSAAAITLRHWTWFEYLTNMTLTTNLAYSDHMVGGLWTLPIEVQMYLVLPVLFLLLRPRPLWPALALWAAAIPLGMVQSKISGRLNVVGFAPCFLGGVIAWRLSLEQPRRLAGRFWPLAFMATWPVFLVASREHHMYYRWAFCLTLGLAIPWFQEMRIRPLVRASHYIAKYSYGIYLSHAAVMLFSFGLPIPWAARSLVFAVLAVISPVLMYHLIEHPMINAGQKVARRVFGSRRPRAERPAATEVAAR
jgi:peptidoglycan/LPS O-acetylase OafA/YrhL